MDMNWRSKAKYPAAEGVGSLQGVQLMDALDGLIPFEQFTYLNTDRLGFFLHWIAAGEKEGLLTDSDTAEIRQELIHGCGGL
jgi:hypothetical protein